MKTISFRGDPDAVSLQTEARLLDALLSKQVPVKMVCGGRGLCATCHVYVTAGANALTPPSQREKLALSVLTGAQPNSRLSCQARVIGDGVEVALPDGMYVESFRELESLIGQRTTVPILHPITGDVLVEAHKIIIRSSIMQLKDLDFSVPELQQPKL
ncbi:MAG: (2Fe-2S)-binding protein [Xanthomonadales bacterium]|jgi:ferredoxin|nr:(2Fe-2S)-binding protein [Xanthomonadales bacterium]